MKIVVDSGCDLTDDMKQQNNISIESVPLTLQIGEKIFIDNETLDLGVYLDEIDQCSSVPKTAAPSPQSYIERFKGSDSIFVVTLSSQVSASYNSAMLAKDMYKEEVENVFIHIFDSLSASVGETLISLKINEFSKKNLSNLEIVSSVNQFIQNMKTYFILENVDTAVKTGRMNPYVAKVANLLSLKPICTARDGKMTFLDKARGYNKAIKKLVDIMLREGSDFENRILGITHVRCLDRALAMKEAALAKIKFKDVIITEATGLCATYASRDGIIIAF